MISTKKVLIWGGGGGGGRKELPYESHGGVRRKFLK